MFLANHLARGYLPLFLFLAPEIFARIERQWDRPLGRAMLRVNPLYSLTRHDHQVSGNLNQKFLASKSA